MPTIKYPFKRITILDECFSSPTGLYSIERLISIVSERLGTSISRRSIYEDIKEIKSLIIENKHHNLEEEEIFQKGLKFGTKKAFRYASPEYALGNQLLSKSGKDQLSETLSVLSRYRNRVEFSWLDELFPRIETAFDLVGQDQKRLISYQSNTAYTGQSFVGTLYNLLVKKKVLEITYEPYHSDPYKRIIHPYHLKQYNNRWFLFGYQDDANYQGITNLALDRIKDIIEAQETYREDQTNWEIYFANFVGVSKESGEVEKIVLRFDNDRLKYFTTKPIHSSFDEIDKDGELLITLDVIINKELVQQLLAYGKDVEVLEPESLKEKMREHVQSMAHFYGA